MDCKGKDKQLTKYTNYLKISNPKKVTPGIERKQKRRKKDTKRRTGEEKGGMLFAPCFFVTN